MYVEYVYLTGDYEIKMEKNPSAGMLANGIKSSKKDDAEVKSFKELSLNQNVTDVMLSHNGRWVSYIENGKLKIFDINENKMDEFSSGKNGEIVYYKWLNEGSSMMIIQKIEEKDGESYFDPVSYDAKKQEYIDVVDFDYNEIKIPITDPNESVSDIQFSTATNVFYIKIDKSNGKSNLYSLNVMNQMKCVKENKNIGNIVVPTTSANCIMEINGGIFALNSREEIKVPNLQNPRILGADKDDYVYFGDEINGKIENLCYCMLNSEDKAWKYFKLKEPAELNEIKIDYSGKLLIIDDDKKTVYDVKKEKEIKYEGNFLQSYGEGIITKNGSEIKFYKF